MDYSKITYQVSDQIAVITFTDTATMNAAGLDTVDELLSAFELSLIHI